jgi:hypothetical protein
MADTGAPWNIPYAEPSDLVRDWPQLSEDVAEAVADGLDLIPVGIGSNVVQTVKDDPFTTTSTSLTVITGLTATITPTSNTSKVLVMCSVPMAAPDGGTNQDGARIQLVRGSTNLLVPASPGSRFQGAMQMSHDGLVRKSQVMEVVTFVFLDSPATDTATTYAVHIQAQGGTVYVNRSSTDGDNVFHTRGVSTLTVIEVAP